MARPQGAVTASCGVRLDRGGAVGPRKTARDYANRSGFVNRAWIACRQRMAGRANLP